MQQTNFKSSTYFQYFDSVYTQKPIYLYEVR